MSRIATNEYIGAKRRAYEASKPHKRRLILDDVCETPGNGLMPILAAVPFSDPPEQQCYLTTINTLPPGWCIPVSPFPAPHDGSMLCVAVCG